MRIDSIDLIRFGHFANREIEFPFKSPDFTSFTATTRPVSQRS